VVVAHLAEPTAAAGAAARVPQVDRWPSVAAAAAQAPGGLRETVRHRFEDGDSPGRCGDGGVVEVG
jgi:hypothetical protein